MKFDTRDQVFDLGEDGKSISKVATASHIAQEAIKMCPRVQNWDAQMFSIIAAAPVTTSESGPVHLVCITQGGLRLYFCTNSSRVNSRLVSLNAPQAFSNTNFNATVDLLQEDQTRWLVSRARQVPAQCQTSCNECAYS